MAVGIDRSIHKKLVERLLQLLDGNETSRWKFILEDLQNAYGETLEMLSLAELAALSYNELQASVRTQVAIELRNRKRTKAIDD